jgi:hypothetical protein
MSVHVYPINEEHLHNLEEPECACGPHVIWIDDETELPWPEGPLVIHERFHPEGWTGIERNS